MENNNETNQQRHSTGCLLLIDMLSHRKCLIEYIRKLLNKRMTNMLVSIPTISISKALEQKAIFIDVRSPAEYEEFHISGAINIPLFSNDERAQIGTIYKQIGQDEAKSVGVELLSNRLSTFYKQYKDISNKNSHTSIAVYCWRGGMRSGSIVTFMAMMGIPLSQLEGGIRSYRKLIQNDLDVFATIKKPFIILEGNTGTRKTDILKRLENEGYPVINLEELACHRGSTFGGIGLQPTSQKEFERNLWIKLSELKEAPYYIIEAESKRLGRVIIPDFILEGKEKGVRIHINSPINNRIQAICESYQFERYHEQFLQATERFKKRLKPAVYEQIYQALYNKKYDLFTKLLLEEYYDPRYNFAATKYNSPIHYISIENTEDGTLKVKEKVKQIIENDLSFKPHHV